MSNSVLLSLLENKLEQLVAATPEAKVKAKIKKILKDHSVYFAMPIGTGYGNSGVPDFLCCVNGHFLAIEAKAGKGTTTALQDKNIREIKESGGVAAVIAEGQLEYLEQLIQLMKQ
jgi:pantoate kinase